MRLRPTAAALLGALALVLPTAGPSLAGGHDDDLGRLEYVIDNDGRGHIRPADNDTCYELTDTSRSHPATAVRNDTESRALLYPNHACNGRVERELQPGDVVHNVEVLSASFVPVHGRRDDWRDDEDRFRAHRIPMDQPGREQQGPRDQPEQEQQGPREEQEQEQQGPRDQPEQEQQGPREEQEQEQQGPQDQPEQEQQGPRDEQEQEQPEQEQGPQDQPEQEQQGPREEQEQEQEQQGPREEQEHMEHHHGGPDMFDSVFRAVG